MDIFTNTGIRHTVEKKGIYLLNPNHVKVREINTWTTMDGKIRFIKDLSDSHLNNILPYILRRMGTIGGYPQKTLNIIQNEIEYRRINNISVLEYE